MISGTTLPNEKNPGTHDGTINWGSTSSNLTVSINATTTSTGNTAEYPTITPADTGMIDRLPEPDNWYAECDITQLPFYVTHNGLYTIFEDAATDMGMSVCILFLLLLIAIAIAIGLGVAIFTGSALLATISAGTFIAVCVSTTAIGWWMLFAFIIIAAGTLYLARSS